MTPEEEEEETTRQTQKTTQSRDPVLIKIKVAEGHLPNDTGGGDDKIETEDKTKQRPQGHAN